MEHPCGVTSALQRQPKILLLLRANLYQLAKRIRVGAVSYKNTRPLLYGIKHPAFANEIELIEEYPAKVAAMLLSNEIDVGLVPVAIIPQLQEAHIITDYCIGAEQAVASVCIFSDVPMEQIETVILDYQSRTSVNLAKVLLRHYWKKEVVFQEATPDFREHIKGTTAAVVIGDRAFEQRLQSPFIYDLAEAWIDFTGLPFVFAAWVANKPLDETFIKAFNNANAAGFNHLAEVVAANPYPLYNLHTYYTQNISYRLTDNKRKGLDLFLHYLQQQ